MQSTHKLLFWSMVTCANTQVIAAPSQNMDTDKTLSKILVTAVQTELPMQQLPVSVEVIDAQTIQNSAAITLQDALKSSGVFFNAATGSGSNSNGQFSIRGVNAKGTLLLINGQRVASEFTKAYDANRIPASMIERIEIIKGPMGAIYGSDALGGVINIVTKRPIKGDNYHESTIHLNSGANQNGEGARHLFEADIRGQKDQLLYSAWFNALKTGAYHETETANIRVPLGNQPNVSVAPSQSNLKIDPNTLKACGKGASCGANFSQPIGELIADSDHQSTDYRDPSETLTVGTQLEYQVSPELRAHLNLSAMQESRSTQGIAQSYQTNYLKADKNQALAFANIPFLQTLKNQRFEVGIGTQWQASEQLQIDWHSSLSHYTKQDQITTPLWAQLGYDSQADSANLSGDGTVQVSQHQMKTTWQANPQHQILIGTDYLQDQREAAFFRADGAMSTQTQTNKGVFIQDNWLFNEKTHIVSGIRWDDTIAGEATTANMGINYQLTPQTSLRTRVAQGFRAPDSQENFINRFNPQGKRFVGALVVDSSINKTATQLQAEQSTSFELGVTQQHKHWQYDIAAYYTEIDHNILRTVTSNYISFRNADQVILKGLDAQLTAKVSPDLKVTTGVYLLKSLDKTTGQKLDYTPNTRANLAIDYQMLETLQTRVSVNYIGQQNYTETIAGKKTVQIAQAYYPVDVKATYQFAEMDLYAGIDNLFSQEIDNVLGSDINRYFYAGLRWFIQ